MTTKIRFSLSRQLLSLNQTGKATLEYLIQQSRHPDRVLAQHLVYKRNLDHDKTRESKGSGSPVWLTIKRACHKENRGISKWRHNQKMLVITITCKGVLTLVNQDNLPLRIRVLISRVLLISQTLQLILMNTNLKYSARLVMARMLHIKVI